MAKRFITPFAEAGDRAVMPDTPVGTDSNYQTGYPSQYEEDPVVNPATAKFVERDKSNQLYNDITANIKEWQEHTYPAFVTSAANGGVPFPYKKNSIVTHLGIDYASKVDGNNDVPPSAKWEIFSTQNREFDTVSDMKSSVIPFPLGTILKTKGYYAIGDGGEADYIVSATVAVDGFGDHVIAGAVAILKVDGWVSAKQYGLKGDRTTDDSAAEAALSASVHLFQYWPKGIYQTTLANGTSDRTYLFEEGCIIDGVIHLTGVGPATVPVAPLSIVKNTRMIGTATTTVRFGTFYCSNTFVDKIHQLAPNPIYINQTILGATGTHLFFGTKSFNCNEIIVDDADGFGAFTADQGVVKGPDELPEDIHIGRLIINKLTGVTGLITAETKNLVIDEIIVKNQGGANVAWISSNDIKLEVGKVTLDGTGADSGQSGIFLQNTDPNASAQFGTVDVSNVPGIAFRTFSTGKVKIGTFIGNNNREHARIQSHVTIDKVEGDASLEIGINFHDNFAAGSSIGRCELTGTVGTGINVGSDDITIPYAKCDGFAALYGLHIPVGTDNFTNHYYEGLNCSQALRILSAGDINMGVMNLHDNTNGIIGSGLGKFGFDYVYYNNNGTDTNVTLELAAGFRGKKVRQSISGDRGDTAVSLEVGIDATTQMFETPLTASRLITFTTINAQNGNPFKIVRTATGAFNLSATGTLNDKALAVNEWMEYTFGAGGWKLTGFGTL